MNLVILTPINWYYDKKESRYLIGTYILDVNNSHYGNLNLHKLDTLTMKVNENNTFSFNENVPFFPKRNGEWSFWVDGDLENIECTFNNITKPISIKQDSVNDWIFESQYLTGGKNGDKIIVRPKK